MTSAKFVLPPEPDAKAAGTAQQRAAIQAAIPDSDWVQLGFDAPAPPKTVPPAAFRASVPSGRMGASQPKVKSSKGNIGPAVPLT